MADFLPVRTTTENLDSIEIKEGQFLVDVDKGLIYMDKGTERLPVNDNPVGNLVKNNPVAIGSFSMGRADNSTIGTNSIAIGNNATASGNNSYAVGQNVTASGENSHAEGYQTTASQSNSHAEGYGTTASGYYCHAEGYGTTASNYYDHAEGNRTVAQGGPSHSEGDQSVSKGYCSHAEGYQTQANSAQSHAEGYQTITNGYYSHAEGYQTRTEDYYTHAEGYHTLATQTSAHAEGYNTTANGEGSHAEGKGYKSIVDIVPTFPEGPTNQDLLNLWSSNKYSLAQGEASHVEGQDCLAMGMYSHAEGYQCVADNYSSHAEGYNTKALNNYAHSEGYNTIAVEQASHAEGYQTAAVNYYSHSGGYYSQAEGNCAFTHGNYTKTTKANEVSFGTFNLSNEKTIFSIGNGTKEDSRNNVFEIDSDGNVYAKKFIGEIDGGSSSGSGGLDFNALSTALTTGTQSGITVSANNENQTFNFEVTGTPTVSIDSEGYWVINGERGENPTKAQGEKGADGISPTANVAQTDTGATITITDTNGETTANITNGKNGADGISPTANVTQTETGASITVTDANGTTTANLMNGAQGEPGTSPHIDNVTKHWFVGETDTGVVAEAGTVVLTSSADYTGTLTVENWIGDAAPYTQVVTITGMTADAAPIIDLVVSEAIETGTEELSQWGYISKAITGENNITFYCYENKPTIALNFKVKLVSKGGESVTNIIDDTSTTGTDVTWSANKINSVIGDINTILASVVGGGI